MNVTMTCSVDGCKNEVNFESESSISDLFKITITCREHMPKPEQDVFLQDGQFDARLERRHYKLPKGMQILTPRHVEIEYPEWAKTDQGIRKVIETAFPALKRSAYQRTRAGRWARVLYLYYHLRWGSGDIAEEMHIEIKMVENVLERARRVGNGKTANGAGGRLA